MPRKTKEINEEKTVKEALAPTTAKAKTTKPKTTKSKATKSTVKEKKAKSKVAKAAQKKTTKSKASEKKIKEVKTEEKVSKTAKKTATSKTTSKKTASKKATTKKTSEKKTTKASTKTPKAKTSTKTKSAKIATPTIVEYYDLPYKYNQTVVKVLYQNPTTLFVYWEISDDDIENYKRIYGDNFFETTKPVLVVYNDTINYHFEIDINDFANSWYFNINDSKCEYRVELIRRPIFYNEKIKTDKIYITSSNKIEAPNDRILFSTDEPYTVYFRNTKNNNRRKVNLPRLLEELNLANKNFGFPIVRNIYDLYKNIYHVEDVGEFSISLTNPSSGNPSSHSLSSRFI